MCEFLLCSVHLVSLPENSFFLGVRFSTLAFCKTEVYIEMPDSSRIGFRPSYCKYPPFDWPRLGRSDLWSRGSRPRKRVRAGVRAFRANDCLRFQDFSGEIVIQPLLEWRKNSQKISLAVELAAVGLSRSHGTVIRIPLVEHKSAQGLAHVTLTGCFDTLSGRAYSTAGP